MTQETLAERSGLSSDGVRRLERGKYNPSLDTIVKLCRGLDISLATLFSGFEQGRRTEVDELCDYVRTRSRAEQRTAWRILRALFDEESSR